MRFLHSVAWFLCVSIFSFCTHKNQQEVLVYLYTLIVIMPQAMAAEILRELNQSSKTAGNKLALDVQLEIQIATLKHSWETSQVYYLYLCLLGVVQCESEQQCTKIQSHCSI